MTRTLLREKKLLTSSARVSHRTSCEVDVKKEDVLGIHEQRTASAQVKREANGLSYPAHGQTRTSLCVYTLG